MSEKIMVVGGSGFIGSHLVDKLLQLGYNVVNVDLKINEKVETRIVDITDINWLNLTFKSIKPEIVFHLAVYGYEESEQNPTKSILINAIRTLNVLKLARKYNVRKVVHSSSGSIYGEPQILPLNEGHPTNPTSIYGVTKLCEEHFCHLMMQRGLTITILRYSNVLGKGRSFGVIYTFKNRIKQDLPLIIFGGKQGNDYVYVDDVVQANIKCLDHGDNETFNIGSGTNTGIMQLAKQVKNILNADNQIIIEKPRPHDPTWQFYYDITKAKTRLKWKPTINFKEMLTKIL